LGNVIGFQPPKRLYFDLDGGRVIIFSRLMDFLWWRTSRASNAVSSVGRISA